MRKILFTLVLLGFTLFSISKVLAQVTEPGANLPLLPDEQSTASVDTSPSGSSFSTLATATPLASSSAVAAQSAVDDAETGSEIIFLAILSVTGGIGLFLIKKYFDLKRYSL